MAKKKIKRQATYKQMAFETAVRNPERYKGILTAISPYINKVLNDETLLQVVSSRLESSASSFVFPMFTGSYHISPFSVQRDRSNSNGLRIKKPQAKPISGPPAVLDSIEIRQRIWNESTICST